MNNDINTIVVDEAFGEILLSAVRYTLGRQTYIVSSTTKYVQSLIPKLDNHTIACMERDIRTAGNYGHETIDKPEWMKLLTVLQQEMQNRNIKPW
jgi:hypothetical protein